MLVGLDHLVVAVRDPDSAAIELDRQVGLACTGGGRHPSWGTFNRLAWLGDTYIELIGLFDRALAPTGAVSRTVLAALDAGREGLVTYAVMSDSLASDLERLRAAGSSLSDIETRSRTRADGEVVSWRASFPPKLGLEQPPFVIEHEFVGAEWGPEARATRATAAHPIGGPARILGIDLPVVDPAATLAAYGQTLGLATGPAVFGDPSLAIGDQHVLLRSGGAGAVATIEVKVIGPTPGAPVREVDAVGVRWRIGS